MKFFTKKPTLFEIIGATSALLVGIEQVVKFINWLSKTGNKEFFNWENITSVLGPIAYLGFIISAFILYRRTVKREAEINEDLERIFDLWLQQKYQSNEDWYKVTSAINGIKSDVERLDGSIYGNVRRNGPPLENIPHIKLDRPDPENLKKNPDTVQKFQKLKNSMNFSSRKS